ncbi:hypothetical protein BDV97DRAFT_157355 [Delphinella strobiligena]|nr:hypothetical protein BDV97DRAFT_157355 [Delphinella strobiligena]
MLPHVVYRILAASHSGYLLVYRRTDNLVGSAQVSEHTRTRITYSPRHKESMCIIYNHQYGCNQPNSHAKPSPATSFSICPKGSPSAPLGCPERQSQPLFCGTCPRCERDTRRGKRENAEQYRTGLMRKGG